MAEVTGIGAQVATALAAAHARGLAHRDVKPDNVVLTGEGVKVIDFGISAIIGGPDADEDGQLVGTPAYVAPERLADVPVGPAADVYALGVLLYRSLTGYLPWDADGRTAMLRAHVFTEPVALPPDCGLPRDLIAIVHACLAKDPASRPSAADLAARLSALAAPDEPRPERRRRGVLVPSLVAVSVALFAGAWAFGGEPRAADPDPPAGAAAAACAATFSVDRDWGKGFDARVTVTNDSPAAVDGWRVSFAFPGSQRVAPAPAGAPAVLRQSGTTVTATARTPGQAIAPNASVTIPITVSYTVDNPIPTRVDLNTVPCQTVITGAAYQPATAQPAGPRTTQPGG